MTPDLSVASEPLPNVCPQPFAVVHVPVAHGAELLLRGVNPAQLGPETLARLSPALERLTQTLRELKLISAGSKCVEPPNTSSDKLKK